ncbi:MAG TPA: nucleotidyl transferase [Verrucomicrobia bacterium]|nr:nucleotidyl transferase [Verrucomicrobiota bacterium]
MQTVILAGGLGTRLRSVAPDIPKALVSVAGRPFIEHQFALLRRHGLTRVLLCIGHLGEMIVEQVGDGAAYGMQVDYSREDPHQLLGTGGALLHALPLLEESFMVMYGDSYLPTDYRAVVAAFQQAGGKAMMTVYRNEGKWDPSNVRIAGNRVVFYSKKAKPGEADYIDYGMTLYRRAVLESWKDAPRPLDLALVQSALVAEGSMAAFEVHERFYEVGKPEGLAELNALLEVRP